MRRAALSALAAASLFSASAAWADDATAPAAPAAPPAPATATAPPAPLAKDDPNRIVCTREHVVGSNRPQKICMTVAERDRQRELAKRGMDESRRGSGASKTDVGSPGGG